MTYRTGDTPDIRKGFGPQGHKVIKTRGRDSWTLLCECGRRWHGWRWLCEERYIEHTMPNIKEPQLLWWDDASYIKYQSMD